MVEMIKGGMAADEFLERETGGVHHVAVVLADLSGQVEAAREEWSYDESDEAKRLVALLAPLDDYLQQLSIDTASGKLTLWRECRRCGGDGGFRDERVCDECGGVGAIRLEESES